MTECNHKHIPGKPYLHLRDIGALTDPRRFTPGFAFLYIDMWWAVYANKEGVESLVFHNGQGPLCNSSRSVAERMLPDHELRQLPLVVVPYTQMEIAREFS